MNNYHYFIMIQSILSNIYLFLLLCSVFVIIRLNGNRNDMNQCGLSYRQVMKVVTESIQPYNQTSQQVQSVQQYQIQPVQLPQFGLYEKNRNYIDMIFMYRI